MFDIEGLVLIVHIVTAVVILGLILLQQGKGADMGASFGSGASQTILGVQGGGNVLTRWTSLFSALFFATSLTLAYFAKQQSEQIDAFDIPEPALIQSQQELPADDGEVPVLKDIPENDEIIFEEDIPPVEAVENQDSGNVENSTEASGQVEDIPDLDKSQ